jgi:hypothetical protein
VSCNLKRKIKTEANASIITSDIFSCVCGILKIISLSVFTKEFSLGKEKHIAGIILLQFAFENI